MVLHEEHHLHLQAKSSGSSRSSSKKNKAKKIPQRGLGVAQLEKLRIEEQQKTSNNTTGSSSSSSNPVVPSPLALPVTPMQPPQQQQRQQPSLPFVTPHDPNPLVRSAISHSLPTADFFKPDQIGFSASNAEELKYLSSIWSEDLSNLNTVEAAMAEKIGILGANQHQYQSPIRLIHNKAGFIPAVSSRVNLQMEPPSNQNYSIITPRQQQEEERISGMNLPWSFHPETAVSFPCKAPPFGAPFLRPEELTALYWKSPSKFEYRGTALSCSKEGASSSNLFQDNWRNSETHVSKRLKENGASAYGEFLSLGTSKLRHPILPSRQPELSLLQPQGAIENVANISADSSQKPFYSFLPMRPTGDEADPNEEGDNTVNGVDTSLKL